MNEPEQPEQTPQQRKTQVISDMLRSTTRKRFNIPHIAEMVEALFDEWNEEGLPPLRAFAKSVKFEYDKAKVGSLQRTNLLQMYVRLLEMATKLNVQNAGDLSLLSEEDLMRQGREMWRDYLPKESDADVGREPDGGGSREAAEEDPA